MSSYVGQHNAVQCFNQYKHQGHKLGRWSREEDEVQVLLLCFIVVDSQCLRDLDNLSNRFLCYNLWSSCDQCVIK